MKPSLRIKITDDNERVLRTIQRYCWRKGTRLSITEIVNEAIRREYSPEFVSELKPKEEVGA